MDDANKAVLKDFSSLRDSLDARSPKTLVVAAAHDAHTLEAVFTAVGILPMQYILVGDRQKIKDISAGLGVSVAENSIVDRSDNTACAKAAVSLIREGRGDVLMKGLIETGTLLKAVLDKESGIRDSSVMSHLAMMEVPAYHKLIVITDGGIVTNPFLQQKAEIVRNAVTFLSRIGLNMPKIAALCALESVSDKMPETADAAELQAMCERGELGECILEGPISFDIAIEPEAAKVKGSLSKITGDVDVLLVPNISAGNILVKSLTSWSGAKLAGCVAGARAPIVLVSRGSSAEEKFLSILLCLRAGAQGTGR